MTALTSTVVYVVVWGLLVFGVLPICFYRCGVGGSKKSDFRIIFFITTANFRETPEIKRTTAYPYLLLTPRTMEDLPGPNLELVDTSEVCLYRTQSFSNEK